MFSKSYIVIQNKYQIALKNGACDQKEWNENTKNRMILKKIL